MKIVVADKIAPAGVDYLKNQEGFEVIEAYGSPPERIRELAADADAFIVRSETRIDSSVIEAAPRLQVVGRAGVGVDNIDVNAATGRGVVVMNTPGGNTLATAELTLAHLLCSVRPLPQAYQTMVAGRWDRKQFSGSELNGKTLGVLGLGRIGSEVARRALAFSMRVAAYDPYLTEDRARSLGVEKMELEELYREADLITVHMPLTDATRNMIDARAIAQMKKGVRLVNCARGGIINEQALCEALESGQVAAAGLDVFTSEPLAADSPLRRAPNLVLSPHLGASTAEAQENVGLEIAECVAEVLRGGSIRNSVNAPSVDSSTLMLLRPYLNLGEKMGSLLQELTPENVIRLTITYWGKIIDLDAVPLTRAIQRGFAFKISGEHVNDVNAPHILRNLGIEVNVTKSNTERDYTELIRVEAQLSGGEVASIEGTLLGTSESPRIVELNGRELEFRPEGTLLIVENNDLPGIVGMLGSVLGEDGVNIANMSLSRRAVGGTAFTALQLDSGPSEAACEAIRSHRAIESMFIVTL